MLARRYPWVQPATAVITHLAAACLARVPCSHSRPTSVSQQLLPDLASRVAGPPCSSPDSGSSTPLLWHAGSARRLCSRCTSRPSPSCASRRSNPPAQAQSSWKFPTTAETGPPSARCSTLRRVLRATIAPMASPCRAPEARSAPVGVVRRQTSRSVPLAHSSPELRRCRACPPQLASSRRTLALRRPVRAHAGLCAMSPVSRAPARCAHPVTSACRARARQILQILAPRSGLYRVLSACTVAPESPRTGRSRTTSPPHRPVSRVSCASPVQYRLRVRALAPLGTTAHPASSSRARAGPTAPAWPTPSQSRASPVSTSRSTVSPRARSVLSVRSVQVSRESFQSCVPRVSCATRSVYRFRPSDAPPDTSVCRTLSRPIRSARWTSTSCFGLRRFHWM
mmetsp:Transcript_10983/g.50734  ORF Transcript_10983/g.50734 Transcript_10983/m.50734 type:complete len:397 (+) Transcript_10983:12884-14074(+)